MKVIPGTYKNRRIASNMSKTVSGVHRSSSSMNTTRRSPLQSSKTSLKELRKFFISVRLLSSVFNASTIILISSSETSPAFCFTALIKPVSVSSVTDPNPPVSNKSRPYFTPLLNSLPPSTLPSKAFILFLALAKNFSCLCISSRMVPQRAVFASS